MKETNRENLCVILMDEGVVDDHLPNHVLNALKTCKTRLVDSLETYDSEAIKKIREQQVELLCRIPRGNKSRGTGVGSDKNEHSAVADVTRHNFVCAYLRETDKYEGLLHHQFF